MVLVIKMLLEICEGKVLNGKGDAVGHVGEMVQTIRLIRIEKT